MVIIKPLHCLWLPGNIGESRSYFQHTTALVPLALFDIKPHDWLTFVDIKRQHWFTQTNVCIPIWCISTFREPTTMLIAAVSHSSSLILLIDVHRNIKASFAFNITVQSKSLGIQYSKEVVLQRSQNRKIF